MSKTIKLEEKTYRDLETTRAKRETFSQTVERLVKFYWVVSNMVYPPGYQERDR